MKPFLCLFFLVFICLGTAMAQTAAYDSAKVISRAKQRAMRFRLSNRDLKKFKADPFPASSDYFKPKAKNIKDTVLINDSLFIKTYRNEAFYNAVNQRTLLDPRELLLPPRNTERYQRPVYNAEVQVQAQNDAQKFRLSHNDLKRFKWDKWPNTSDHFKPNNQTTANIALLNDSVYVKTFRNEAFYKCLNTRLDPTGHAIVIASIVTVSTAMLVLLLVAVSRIHFY